jgi:hypothetical protein
MRLSVSIGDVVIDYEDDQETPSLDGLESTLNRITDAAIHTYTNTETMFVAFIPESDDEADTEEATEDE